MRGHCEQGQREGRCSATVTGTTSLRRLRPLHSGRRQTQTNQIRHAPIPQPSYVGRLPSAARHPLSLPPNLTQVRLRPSDELPRLVTADEERVSRTRRARQRKWSRPNRRASFRPRSTLAQRRAPPSHHDRSNPLLLSRVCKKRMTSNRLDHYTAPPSPRPRLPLHTGTICRRLLPSLEALRQRLVRVQAEVEA